MMRAGVRAWVRVRTCVQALLCRSPRLPLCGQSVSALRACVCWPDLWFGKQSGWARQIWGSR